MSTLRRLGASAIIIVVASAVAGRADALPDREWRRRASAVCTRFHADRTEILPTSGLAVVSPEDAQSYVEQAVPLYERLRDEIDALREPKSHKKGVKLFVTAVNDAVATITENPLAAFSAFEDPFADANRAAKRLELKSCRGLGDQRL
jgi:hypothetical protein